MTKQKIKKNWEYRFKMKDKRLTEISKINVSLSEISVRQ